MSHFCKNFEIFSFLILVHIWSGPHSSCSGGRSRPAPVREPRRRVTPQVGRGRARAAEAGADRRPTDARPPVPRRRRRWPPHRQGPHLPGAGKQYRHASFCRLLRPDAEPKPATPPIEYFSTDRSIGTSPWRAGADVPSWPPLNRRVNANC